jgi:hypothetical protein
MRNTGICTCKQYNVPCDDQCNCCDSPYAIEGCDCPCKDEKAEAVAQIIYKIMVSSSQGQVTDVEIKKAGKDLTYP